MAKSGKLEERGSIESTMHELFYRIEEENFFERIDSKERLAAMAHRIVIE
jgi:hypothetical protein